MDHGIRWDTKKTILYRRIIIQISADTLSKAAAQAASAANAASGPARTEAMETARSLQLASKGLEKPIELGSPSNPIPSWMSIAYKEVGQAEVPGSANNPRILEYIGSVNPSLRSEGDEIGWSGFFKTGFSRRRAYREPGAGLLIRGLRGELN
jgi:hypothetical protein